MDWRRKQRCFLFVVFLLVLLLARHHYSVVGFSLLAAPSLGVKHSLTLIMQESPPSKQPMYITIGPPCAGKTTLLHRLEERMNTSIHDVTLDNQRDVYVQVPTEYFLVKNNTDNDDDDVFLKRRIQYKSLKSRIYDNATNLELRAMLQRFHGKLSFHDFESAIHDLYQQHANMTNNTNRSVEETYQQMATIVIDTVEEILQTASKDNNTLTSLFPSHIQLFCVESLFRPHPDTNKTGIEMAHDELWTVAKQNLSTTSIAWGNTNTRPREYREALQVAAVTQRPVYFLIYDTDNNDTVTSQGVFLPNVGMKELVRRNILRMLSTGKFVPGRALMESNQRIQAFLEMAVGNLQRKFPLQSSFTKLELDQELARMVNYEMLSNRTVRRIKVKQKRRPQRPKTTATNQRKDTAR